MKNLYTLVTFFIFSIAFGQNPVTANFDASFNHRDELLMKPGIKKIKELPDGKILVLSGTTPYEGLSYNLKLQTKIGQFYRLNQDLTIDETFVPGFTDITAGGYIYDFDVCSDGKIVLVGSFNTYNGATKKRVVKLNPNGDIDSTFTLTSSVSYIDLLVLYSVKVLSNNSIYISGRNLSISSGMHITRSIGKLTPTGNFDTSFKCNLNCTYVDSFDVQNDGKVVSLSSLIITSPASTELKVSRFNSNGTNDTTFNVLPTLFGTYTAGSGFSSVGLGIDNKIYISGSFTANNKFLRLNTDGTLDTAFLPFKKLGQNSFILNSDSSISVIFEGSPNASIKNKISKIDNTGALVSESNSINGIFTSFARLNNGDYYTSLYWDITLNSTLTRHSMHLRLNSDGNQYYSTTNSTNFAARKIVRLNSNELLLLGSVKNRGEIRYHNGIKKITNNGDLLYNDNLFNPFLQNLQLLETDGNRFMDCKMQSDGKMVLLMETVKMVSSVLQTKYKLIRLNQDFSVDSSFNFYNTNLISKIQSFVILPNGKILFCYGSLLKRLNTDGALDTQYAYNNLPQTFDNSLYSLCAIDNNKFLVGGYFNQVANNTNYKGLCLLDQDGVLDTQFVYPFAGNVFVSSILSKNNKIILCNGQNVPFRRLNSNLTIDTSYQYSAVTYNGYVKDVQIQDDNSFILIVTTTNNVYSELVKLTSTGLLDAGFNTENAFDGVIYSTLPLNDGSILVSGDFNRYNGIWCNGIIKLLGDVSYQINGANKFDWDVNGCTLEDLNYGNLKFSINNQNQYFANTSGSYAFTFSQPGTYTLIPIIENPNYFTISPSVLTATFPVPGNGIIQDFCITPNGIHPDIEITMLPLNSARPGFDANYKLVCKNKGNQHFVGSFSLNFDDNVLDFVSSSLGSTSATGIRTWSFVNLQPLETLEIAVKFNLNLPTETPPLNAGNVLSFTANATYNNVTDENLNDNTFVLNQTVVNSYDPNDKTCLQGTTVGMDKVGEYVHYVIRFENTGTYAAQNITVKDVIDTDKFDINTLIPLNGSHSFTTKISEGNKVEFYFENINLPFADATNDGYLAFKIKTKSTLVAGDTFGGLANIFFDYNSAITTNTYTTTIQTLSVKDFSFENYFSLYPNPVSDILNIDKKGDIEISSIHIYNVMGQLMMVVPNAKNVSTLDVSNLSSGNYFVKINSDKGTSNTKFIKR